MSDLAQMTRNQIAAFVGDDPRAIKALETLLHNVNVSIPSQVQTIQTQIVVMTDDDTILTARVTAVESVAAAASATATQALAEARSAGVMSWLSA